MTPFPSPTRTALVLLLAPLAAATGTFPEPPPGSTVTTATFLSPSAVAIVDDDVAQSAIAVSGLPGTVWDVNVVLNIDHPRISDLEVSLVPPVGGVVSLTYLTTFPGLDTTFDDSAPVTVVNVNITDHLIAPQGAFASLLGNDPSGTWTLRIVDRVSPHGGFFTWRLEIATVDQEPPAHTTSAARADGLVIGSNSVVRQDIDLAASGTVRGVDVVLHVSHADPSDLFVSLKKDGRACLLGFGHGNAQGFYANATFDDDSANHFLVSDPGAGLGTAVPLAALGTFRDLEAAGVWQLEILNIGPDLGSLLGWELVVESYGDAQPVAICVGAAPAPCPCDNHGAPGSGCRNATHADGASLAVEVGGGGPTVVGGDVVLVARDLDPFQIVLFVQGTQAAEGGAGVPFGDGLLCAGGQVRRLATRYSGFGSTSYPGLFDQPLWQRGGIPRTTGGTRVYQALYRSPLLFGPCHTGMNSTNGVRITWLPEEQ